MCFINVWIKNFVFLTVWFTESQVIVGWESYSNSKEVNVKGCQGWKFQVGGDPWMKLRTSSWLWERGHTHSQKGADKRQGTNWGEGKYPSVPDCERSPTQRPQRSVTFTISTFQLRDTKCLFFFKLDITSLFFFFYMFCWLEQKISICLQQIRITSLTDRFLLLVSC